MMNILARILSHGFAITVVVILAVGYIYRGDLFPGMELPAFLYPGTPAQTEGEVPADDVDREEPSVDIAGSAVVDDADTAAMEPPAETAAVEPPAETAAVEPPAETAAVEPPAETAAVEPPAETAAVEPPAETAAVEPPAETAAVEPATAPSAAAAVSEDLLPQDTSVPGDALPAEQAISADVSAPQAAVESADITPAESTQPVEGVQDTVSTVADESAAEAVAAISPPADTAGAVSQGAETSARPGETANPYQLLAAAREAFWLHDYAEAEANYRRLIALEPDNPDGYGELGNMYFTQGNWEQAAAAYFDAGKNLVIEGRIRQAEVLVNVIRGLNGNQAGELAELIAAARAPDTGTR